MYTRNRHLSFLSQKKLDIKKKGNIVINSLLPTVFMTVT
jgi:hypothetical protein